MLRLILIHCALILAGATHLFAQSDFKVVVQQTSLPTSLNPLTSQGATARYIQNCIFSSLLEYDPNSLKLRPQLATDFPKVTKVTSGEYQGGVTIEYTIHPEATWDNKQPVTGHDYVFTIKALKNPLVKTGGLRPYYEFVSDIKVDESNPKKFTIYSKEPYFLAEETSGELHILPEYAYDANQLLRKISIMELNKPEEELKENATLKKFADEFAQKKYENDPKAITGSSAYKVGRWDEKELVLERKKDWWGDKVSNIPALDIGPDAIVHRVYAKPLEALKAMKAGEIDVMPSVRPQFFLDLKSNPKFAESFELGDPMSFSYMYIGFNNQHPILSDKNVRKAFGHLINRDDVIEALYNNMAKKINSSISPLKSYYHDGLKDIDYNPKKAVELLAKAGWKDTDGDGVLDKVVNGKKQALTLNYKYNKGNSIRKNVGLLLQMEGEKIGVKVEVEAYPWGEFLDHIYAGNTEIFCISWVQGPGLDDMKQIWHTSSFSPEGSNNSFFGNKDTDALIDEIRATLDEDKRKELYFKMQEIMADEQPYVFLFAPQYRIAISKKFDNIKTNSLAPGFQARFFQKKESR
ncbi:MAG: ABC transporter substrate-binding protein [Saprospiraceae bacterium]|nr:ABC transporter substrate-binding protein [Saprospiraceae bacterium]